MSEEHMSIILEDDEGKWYYVSYIGSEVIFEEITDVSALVSISSLNQSLRDLGILEEGNKDFEKGVYIPGDFNSSVEKAKAWNKNANSMPYSPTRAQQTIDQLLQPLTKLEDTKYSLLFNNCSHVAMNLLGEGISDSGEKIGDDWKFSVTTSPKENLKIASMYSSRILPVKENVLPIFNGVVRFATKVSTAVRNFVSKATDKFKSIFRRNR